MKRIFMALTLAAVMICCAATAAAAETGTYTWQDRTIEVSGIAQGGMWAPAGMTKDEYCVSVTMSVDEELWKDEELSAKLYAETILTDAEGQSYLPQTCMTGTDKPVLIYSYCIPKTVEFEALTLRFGVAGEEKRTLTLDGTTVELTDVNEDIEDFEHDLGKADGKWVRVVLTITDGEIPINLVKEKLMTEGQVRLNGDTARTMIAQGVKISDEMEVLAVGTVNLFFDVPAETEVELSQIELAAEETVSTEKAPVPGAALPVPKINPVVPKINPVVPKINPVVPKINPVVPKINPVVPKINPVVPSIPPIPSIPPVPNIPTIPGSTRPVTASPRPASAAALDWPANGVIWKADGLGSGTELTVQVNQPSDLGTHIKIYKNGTELAAMLFIGGEGSAAVSLPGGTYTIKDGTGKNWYGPEESFGDSGSYEVMTFDGGATSVTLNSGYAYTITVNVQSASPDADSVGSRRTTHDAF